MAITQFELGPGVTCTLKDTKDQYGVEVVIEGTFRHGGLTHDEIKSRLLKAFVEIDVDFNQTLQSDDPGEEG